MQRPVGIKILAWFMIILGVLATGLLLFTLDQPKPPGTIAPSALKIFYDVAMAVLGVICGVGLLKIEKWAWFGITAMFVLSLVNNVISLTKINQFERQSQIVGLVLGFAVNGALIAYLMRRDIRQLFQILK